MEPKEAIRRRQAPAPARQSEAQWSIEHFGRILWHRKWLVAGVFAVVSLGTFTYTHFLPNVYSSETVILVDPQKVPEAYVKSTVTGDVRNRLGTLSQQILSVTRLQKIVETLNLYPEQRKTMAREDVITQMRRQITVDVLSDFGASQDLQAFRISFSGSEPRQVAQVANQLASLFIEENLRAREQKATGTTEFLENRLIETRKQLEEQEARLRDFRLRHIGAMPEQEATSLQIMGQLQAQMQTQNEALARAEQQKSYLQSLMVSQSAPVVDLDMADTVQRPKPPGAPAGPVAGAPRQTSLQQMQEKLAALRSRYSDDHPDIRKLRYQIQLEEKKSASASGPAVVAAAQPVTPASAAEAPPPTSTVSAARPAPVPPSRYVNPVLESQLRTVETEIARHHEERQRLGKQIAGYQAKLESIPLHEQQIASLQRDYEISKTHYKQLLEKELGAQTATQLELRQKGEKFTVLDPAQPAERPIRPNRPLLNAAGAVAGLGLGLLLALITELMGLTVTSAEQITATFGVPVLEVVPVIRTRADALLSRRRYIVAGASAGLAGLVGAIVFIVYRYKI
ncbi:MAG: hypothetical protein IT162_04145 [Bryobacterales bacterium]|nr:hypothetical protein [Bryobacterales bacterium]